MGWDLPQAALVIFSKKNRKTLNTYFMGHRLGHWRRVIMRLRPGKSPGLPVAILTSARVVCLTSQVGLGATARWAVPMAQYTAAGPLSVYFKKPSLATAKAGWTF